MLNIKDQCDGNRCVIKLEGELVATSLEIFRGKIKELIAKGITDITFDMSLTDAVDSAGIGFIAAVHNSLVKVGGVLKLVELSKDMYQFFVCLRMNTHFTIEAKNG